MLVSFKLANNVFNLILRALKVKQLWQISSVVELLFYELYLSKIIDNVALKINEPSTSIYLSQVLINLVPKLIFQNDWSASFIVVKVAKAQMWIKIMVLHTIR